MAASDSEEAADEGEYLQEVAFVEDAETTCTICQAEFLDSEDLDMHMQQVHLDPTEFYTPGSKVCQFCDATYRDFDEYARHIATTHLCKLICCEYCLKCFTDNGKAKLHERKHKQPSKNALFSCSQCTASFATCKELQAHERVYHDNNHDGEFLHCMPHLSFLLKMNALTFLQSQERVLKCNSCKFTTEGLNSYLEHLDDNNCNVYVCDICCYVSHDRKNLMKHCHRQNKCMNPLTIVSNTTTCPSCKKSIHCKEMKMHNEICNRYKCYLCNIRFKTIEDLSDHQSAIHPVELDVIKCRFCNKEYVGQVSLDRHMKRSHSHQFILYKYTCRSCDQIFKHPQELFTHYFMKHKELEPYTCKLCNTKFRIRKRFTIHIKLEHKGAGVVEFDEDYHVFFTDKKSENPFVPKCVIPELVPQDKAGNATQEQEALTDINETDMEANKKTQNKGKAKTRGRKRKRTKTVTLTSSSSEDEAESLLTIKKRAERKHFQKKFSPNSKKLRMTLAQRKQFTCKVCKKYCYTFQNYHNHIKIHTKNESIECIKCAQSFKTKTELSKHVAKEHATSKLIETLKSVLERKQIETQAYNNDNIEEDNSNFDDLTPSERFSRTIKKVRLDKQAVSAIIAPSSGNISVKNFIENFVPDVGETVPKETKQVEEEPVVTVRHYDSPFYRKKTIKMTKFVPEAPVTEVQLKMPERFKAPSHLEERVKLNVKLVHQPLKISAFQTKNESVNYDTTDHHDYECYEDNDNAYDGRDDAIPEVAQEVMLEGTEEPPKPKFHAPHKIVIPKLPDGYPKIHIATLQPQAPYYKIITVKNNDNTDEAIVINPQKHKTPKEERFEKMKRLKNDVISLPDGTKFVSANPLAHLLGDKPVEEILEPNKNKHYKPRCTNIKGLLTDALQNLDKPNGGVRKLKKKFQAEKSLPLL